jgi:predicted CxxxxCH...CXXCH cytochrome family protein
MTVRTRGWWLVVAGTLSWAASQAGRSASAQPPTPASQVVQQGAHRAHVFDTPTHRAYTCERCHGRGGATVTIETWDAENKSCVSAYCHGGFQGGVAATLRWQPSAAGRPSCRACHGLPPATGAHPVHTRADGYAIGCLVCHGGPEWIDHHTAGSIFVALQPRAGAGSRYADATCSGVACHSNGRGAAQIVRWTDPPRTCSSCHDDETSNAPHMSGQHVRHFRLGLACADCHGAVVDRAKRIIDYRLHDNGSVDVKVLSGKYSAGACQPACHEPRSW